MRHGLFGPLQDFAMLACTRAHDAVMSLDELSIASSSAFEPCPENRRDDVVRHLAAALGPALQRADAASVAFVSHVATALRTYLAKGSEGPPGKAQSKPGSLPAWKERRVKELMRQELANKLSLERLATECNLSIRHFTRAFRSSTGVSPHRYLLDLRLEKARQLLCDPAVPLQEVAMACGFADQSHFTRAFGAVEKRSPGVWRREHAAESYLQAS